MRLTCFFIPLLTRVCLFEGYVNEKIGHDFLRDIWLIGLKNKFGIKIHRFKINLDPLEHVPIQLEHYCQ